MLPLLSEHHSFSACCHLVEQGGKEAQVSHMAAAPGTHCRLSPQREPSLPVSTEPFAARPHAAAYFKGLVRQPCSAPLSWQWLLQASTSLARWDQKIKKLIIQTDASEYILLMLFF